MVTTFVFDEFQVALEVMSCVVPFEVVAIAVNCLVFPWVMLVFVGVTVMLWIFASTTVAVVEPVIVAEVAVIVALPSESPVTRPEDVPTVATVLSSLVHCTFPVMSLVLPSS